MGKYNLLKSNFSSGELSPTLEGRSDIKEYNQGVALFENFHTMKSGGAAKRQGSRYVGTISNMTNPTLIPFETSRTETYVILIDPTAITSIQIFSSDGVAQTVNQSKTMIAFAPELDTSGFYYTQSSDVMFITHTSSAFKPIYIARSPNLLGDIEFDVQIWTGTVGDPYFASYSAYSDHGAKFFIDTYKKYPYLDNNIDGNKLLKVADLTGNTTLSSENAATAAINFFTADHIGAYFKISHTGPAKTGACVVTGITALETSFANTDINTGTNTITVSHTFSAGDKVYFRTGGAIFAPIITSSLVYMIPYYVTEVTSTVSFKLSISKENAIASTPIVVDITTQGTGTHYVIDASGTSVSAVQATVVEEFGAATATDNWHESAWSYYQGWPKCVTIHEARLTWGGSTANPDFIWMSRQLNLVDLMSQQLDQDTATVTSDDPLFFALGSDRIPQIQWISGGDTLQVGTLSTEYIISGGDSAISATADPQVRAQTAHGGVDIRPYRVGNTLLFVGRDSKRIRDYIFNVKNGSYISQNLNVLSNDIIMNAGSTSTSYSEGTIIQMAYQASASILWVLTSRNVLLSLTYDIDTKTSSWARHAIGGTNAKVYGIAAVSNQYGNADELWITVGRTINGATAYYLEKIGVDFHNSELKGQFTSEDDLPFYSDSSLRLTDFGSAKVSWSGLTHLEGETVKVLADGVIHADLVVSGGAITVGSSVEEVIVGLEYKAIINSMDLHAGAQFDSASGNVSRIDRLYLHLFNSFGGSIGRDSSSIESIEYAVTLNNPLFSGGIKQAFNGTPDEEAKVYIEHNDPLPFNLLTMTMRGVSYD